MVIPKGYKQTEIGVIPEEWENKPLKMIAPLQRGFDLPYSDIVDGCYPVVFSNGTGSFHNRYMVKGPGVVTGRSGTIGKVSYIQDDFWPHNTTLWVTDFLGNNAKFIYYLFTTINWRNYNSGSSVPTLNRNDIHSTIFACPPLPEQEKIAEALSDTDELISSLEKLIAKKKAIKQGAMQQLLTGKTRLPGFSGKWKTFTVGERGYFISGGTPSKSMSAWWNGSIPWISSSDLSENSINKLSINRYITDDAIKGSATQLCPVNSILIVSRVGVGKVAVAPCKLCTSQDFSNLVVECDNPYFLAFRLCSEMQIISKRAQGTSIKGVTIDDISAIEVMLPKIDEQNAVVSTLSDMGSEIDVLEQKLAKYRQIKQGMMQQLLTGKIRLV
jgi:type I restriction enzyme S subunit